MLYQDVITNEVYQGFHGKKLLKFMPGVILSNNLYNFSDLSRVRNNLLLDSINPLT